MISDVYRDASSLPPPLRFLAGGGEATRLVLERDWSDHPLGAPEGWPATLKTMLGTVLNSPESMILCWGRDELTFFFNETYFPLLGPRVSWAMGTPFRVVWADAWDQARPIIDDAFAGRSQRFIDLPWRLDTDRGPADTWFTFSYSRVLDQDGAVAGLFVFTNETTERVLADAALRQSEERLRLVVEGARDHVIFTTDPDGIITTWSAGAEAVLGWSPAEAVGQPASTTLTRGTHDEAGDGAAPAGRTPDQGWHVRKDGTRVFLNGSVHPLPADAQGDPRGFINIARDETERRRAQHQLEELNATLEQRVAERSAALLLYQDIFKSDPNPVCAFDTRHAIVAFNQAFSDEFFRIYAYRPRVGDDFPSLFLPDQGASIGRYLDRARDGEAFTIVERFGHPDHAMPMWEISFNPLRSADDTIIGVVQHGVDVNEQTIAEAELAEARDALRQSQKMEAVGQLTGGLAHDFNNLLTGIMGNLELLQTRVARGRLDDIDRFVTAAQGAGRRAASLTQRLLAFSRRQTLDPKPTDVNRLIAGMEDLLRRTVGGTAQIEVVGAAGLWVANIDPGQLENAVLNLCINARDAMPDGGRITIETANKWLDERTARERDLLPGQYLSVCVTDTGCGMSADTIERAFEPFYTTKPIGQGTGLGLSMIYGFARQSGGQVRLYSELGRGTTVCVYLPRHLGEVDREQEAETTVRIDDASGQTVLIVDDEATIRHLVDEVLDEAGYTVIGAADGAAGIKVLQSGARVELLITDVGLPNGMNGRQVADAARSLRPGLKVLFITGYAENAAIGNGHLEPGMELLTKPFSMDGLLAKVSGMLRS